jgi:peptidoglycan hydrolase CwlO-like protein
VLHVFVYSGIMHVMARETWTDERLDGLKEHMDEGFREVRADLKGLRSEMNGLRSEIGEVRGEVGEVRSEIGTVREGLGEVRAEIKGLNRTLQVGFGLIGSFLGVLTILIGTQL